MKAGVVAVGRRIGWRPRPRRALFAARLRAERAYLTALGARRPRSSGRVLCYHSVGTSSWGVNDVSPARFRRHVELALAAGYRFVPAAEIAASGGHERDLAITFDDGLASVARNAAPVLAGLGIPWTVFIVTAWADGATRGADDMLGWRDVDRLAREGAEIGSHSLTHRNFAGLSATEIESELEQSRLTIERRIGVAPTAFAIPFGRARDWPAEAGRAASAAGYRAVYAQAEATRPPNTVPRTFVTRYDGDRTFAAALRGAFDDWEEAF